MGNCSTTLAYDPEQKKVLFTDDAALATHTEKTLQRLIDGLPDRDLRWSTISPTLVPLSADTCPLLHSVVSASERLLLLAKRLNRIPHSDILESAGTPCMFAHLFQLLLYIKAVKYNWTELRRKLEAYTMSLFCQLEALL
ncbi:hypothetical protein DPMN_090102 [Dreissena polymorpha]|uniref:Uncharacterized protein n=1 Tax=Dreissena polymorpha TaxID=45954 RepID=A0A9D4QXX4_DREPO|nr:hypothetical protein DPMN_090102 [Dreissena polymorpha]